MMETAVPGGDGPTRAAVAVCRACEQLLAGVEDDWPGGAADRALARLRARIEAIRPRPAVPSAVPGADAPRLEVRCLGPTRLVAGGALIDPPRRSRLVLQYLLAHRARPVHRDVLLEAFWPGSSPAAARNSLNVAITLLRRAFRPVYGECPVVVYRDEAYRLDPSLEIWVDREEMERLATEGAERRRSGSLRAAVTLYRAAWALYGGPLFEDEPYEDWIRSLRRSVEATHLDALADLGSCLAALGDHEGSSDAYRAVLAVEPYREDVHQILMERYAADGRRSLALRQYDACRESLRRLLDAEPGPELSAARARILGSGRPGRIDKSPVIAA
jgi:DNA-binding SARP family transcriptional activator